MAIHAACTTALLRAEWRFQTSEFIELTRYEAASGFPFSFSNTRFGNRYGLVQRIKNPAILRLTKYLGRFSTKTVNKYA
jgi:hypothetical protein